MNTGSHGLSKVLLLALPLMGCEGGIVTDDCLDVTTVLPYSVGGPDAVPVNAEAIYALEGGNPRNVHRWVCGRNTDRLTSSDCTEEHYTDRFVRYGRVERVGDGTHRVIYRAPDRARDIRIVASVVVRSHDPFCPPSGSVRKMLKVVEL